MEGSNAVNNAAANQHPPVKMREKKHCGDLSETERKRRSRNRLSNRRSTGYVSMEELNMAMEMEMENRETTQQ